MRLSFTLRVGASIYYLNNVGHGRSCHSFPRPANIIVWCSRSLWRVVLLCSRLHALRYLLRHLSFCYHRIALVVVFVFCFFLLLRCALFDRQQYLDDARPLPGQLLHTPSHSTTVIPSPQSVHQARYSSSYEMTMDIRIHRRSTITGHTSYHIIFRRNTPF